MINEDIDYFVRLENIENIFQKIFDNYKNGLPYILDAWNLCTSKNKKSTNETDYLAFENDISFNTRYPYTYLKKEDKFLRICFLIKGNFINEENQNFSYWICSYDYFVEKIKYLGYKEAKINKKKIYSMGEETKDDNSKISNISSSSESLDDKNTFEKILLEKIIKLKKNPFNLHQIFEKSQKIFNPVESIDEIDEYKKDLNINKNIDKSKFTFNYSYTTDLTNLFNNSQTQYYIYNEKSGLTLSLFQILETNRDLFKSKYFYFNCKFLKSKLSNKKKYFAFKIGKLYSSDEENLFVDFFSNQILKELEGEFNSDKVINIIKIICEKFENIYVIFDHVNSIFIFNKIQKLLISLKDLTKNKIFMFIKLNNYIFDIIKIIQSTSESITSLFPVDDIYKQNIPPTEYFNSFSLENNINTVYEEQVKYDISLIYENQIDYLIFLVKLFINCLLKNCNYYCSKNELDYFTKFIPYLYIFFTNNNYEIEIKKIKFRTKFIQDTINDNISLLLSKSLNDNTIFEKIKTKSTEGIYTEKQIIFYLLFKCINYEKISIEQIYCFNSTLEGNINKTDLFFYQELDNSPIYDFGIVKYFNESLTFKGYQIGINKPRKALNKLEKEKLKLDILYFINKINNKLGIKITKYCFGIITTKYAFDANNKNNNKESNINDGDYFYDNIFDDDINIENGNSKEEENDNTYKNYYKMKQFCESNNYEFIIFDPRDNQFYIEEKKQLKKINFNTFIEKTENVVSNYLFNSQNEKKLNLIKLPIYPREITVSDKNSICDSVKNINNKSLKIIGKFETSDKIDFNDLINDNYLIYKKDNMKDITIFYKKNFIVNECLNSDILYIFNCPSTFKEIKPNNNNLDKEVGPNKPENKYLHRKTNSDRNEIKNTDSLKRPKID